MQFIFKILFIFILGSTFGYLLEVVFRSIKLKRLVKPGFLAGCCLPIYGTGAVILYLQCLIDLSFIENKFLQVLSLVIVATIAMTIIEYVAGFISIKYFKNRLWDYSNRWGNIQGIVCPLFSCIWGVCCLLFYFLVFPWIGDFAERISTNIVAIFFIGIYYGVFLVDLMYSLNVMAKIRTYAIKVKELVNFDNFKKAIAEKYKSHSGKKSIVTFKLYSRISAFLEEHKFSRNAKVEITTNGDKVIDVDVKESSQDSSKEQNALNKSENDETNENK